MSSTTFLAGWTSAMRDALQWRLLLLWLLVLLIPAAILVLPIWTSLSLVLDHSLYADTIARALDAIAVSDLMSKLTESGPAIGQAAMVSALLALLLSPFLNGAAITAVRAPAPLGFAALIQGGVREYGRLLRMQIWALLPLGLAFGLASIPSDMASAAAQNAILEADANLYGQLAMLATAVLLLLAHATVDAGRAQFALYSKRRSAIKAWWSGLKAIKRSLLTMLGGYLLITIVGLLIAALVTAARLSLPMVGMGWTVLGMLLAQLVVALVAWMRVTRLMALARWSRPLSQGLAR